MPIQTFLSSALVCPLRGHKTKHDETGAAWCGRCYETLPSVPVAAPQTQVLNFNQALQLTNAFSSEYSHVIRRYSRVFLGVVYGLPREISMKILEDDRYGDIAEHAGILFLLDKDAPDDAVRRVSYDLPIDFDHNSKRYPVYVEQRTRPIPHVSL